MNATLKNMTREELESLLAAHGFKPTPQKEHPWQPGGTRWMRDKKSYIVVTPDDTVIRYVWNRFGGSSAYMGGEYREQKRAPVWACRIVEPGKTLKIGG